MGDCGGVKPVLKTALSLPPGLKECLSSLGVIEKDGSHQVSHRRDGEELDVVGGAALVVVVVVRGGVLCTTPL